MARYWSINTAVTAVPLIAHLSPIEVAAATAPVGGKGRFWCAACNSVNRICSTSTLFKRTVEQVVVIVLQSLILIGCFWCHAVDL